MQTVKYTIKFNPNLINLSKNDLSEISNTYVFENVPGFISSSISPWLYYMHINKPFKIGRAQNFSRAKLKVITTIYYLLILIYHTLIPTLLT